MKKVTLHDVHAVLGAKIVPFAGFEMPVQYTGVTQEHICVRNGVGVFDVSHMGEFFVRGPHALELIQKVTSNDASQLFPGKVQYSCLPNGKGGIVDDLLVYCISEEEFLLVVNASNIEKDLHWIQSQNSMGAEIENASDSYSLFAVQGPLATAALQSLSDVNLASMEYYTFKIDTFAGVKDVVISATGYTGAGGFEIYVQNSDALHVWEAIMNAGKEYQIQPIGLAARDTLRLEMGFCLYGNDIDDSTSPIEAGLGWITKFTKDFIDKPLLLSQKENGTDRRLVGFELIDRGIPRQGYTIRDENGHEIGVVTSGTQSPSMGKAIGMGYVKSEFKKPDTEIFIEVRGKNLRAKVVKLPFFKKTN